VPFGGNIQGVMRPDGLPVWISEVEPGSVHDLTAAHEHALGALYAAAAGGLPTLADAGYEGAGHGVYTQGLGKVAECPVSRSWVRRAGCGY
jgi:hypothetical protein